MFRCKPASTVAAGQLRGNLSMAGMWLIPSGCHIRPSLLRVIVGGGGISG